MHQISDAKRQILDKLESGGRVEKRRLYSGTDFPASLIKGAIARLESDRMIQSEVDAAGREFYTKTKGQTVKKILRLFSK